MKRLWFVSFGDHTKAKGEQAMGLILLRDSRNPVGSAKIIATAAGHNTRHWIPHIYAVAEDGPNAQGLEVGRFYTSDELDALGYTR